MSIKRKYDSSLRAERAAETRLRIQKTARKLLAANGFDGTTVSAIAAEAGVSPQTVYSVFGSKGAIVAEMMTHLEQEAGEDGVAEALLAESDPRIQLKIFVAWIRKLFTMSADVFVVVLQSPNQPDMATMIQEGNARRLGGCRFLTEQWAERDAIRGGMKSGTAAEQLWLLTSVETYLSCVNTLGWSPDQYEEWVYNTAERLLFR